MTKDEILTEQEKDQFEKMLERFVPMTIEEQMILYKMFIFNYFECYKKAKGKDKKSWLIQAQTYEFLIQLFSNLEKGLREFIFKIVLEDYKKEFITEIKA